MAEDMPKSRIEPVENGPFFYERGEEPRGTLRDARREEIAMGESALLCRCGGSGSKPFCDNTHTANGFTSERLWKPGRGTRLDYEGREITIHDNRALCAHVEYCVQGLPTVFDRSRRPWIDPDGASAEEVIATIERCPSGALSYSVDGVEHRDQEREPTVVASKNGPYLIEGGVEVAIDEPRSDGSSAEHCTLCRCGASRNKPFCEGRHWQVEFEDGQE